MSINYDQIKSLNEDALQIFDGPECSQAVRDAIEWYHNSLLVLVYEPDYRQMFGDAIKSISEISMALGIDEEEAACANGNTFILEAIQRKNEALLAAVKRP